MIFRNDRLRELRKTKRLRQDEVADLCGVGRTAVCNWEAGARVPEIEKMIYLADLFETSVDYLLGRSDNPNRPDMEVPNAKTLLERDLHWDGVPLTPQEMKPIRDMLQMVVRERLPRYAKEVTQWRKKQEGKNEARAI